MRTLSAALTCSASHRIGPSLAIFPCCHMSTETLQPPCHCRNSAKATTPCWKAGFWAGYTIKTGMGTVGDVCNSVKPNDLERLSLNLRSGKREGKKKQGGRQTRLQWQTVFLVLLTFFIIFLFIHHYNFFQSNCCIFWRTACNLFHLDSKVMQVLKGDSFYILDCQANRWRHCVQHGIVWLQMIFTICIFFTQFIN